MGVVPIEEVAAVMVLAANASQLQDESFVTPPLSGLVIYQADLADLAEDVRDEKMDSIAALGMTAIELVAAAEVSITGQPHIPVNVALERSLGDEASLRDLVAQAHQRGLAVILSIAYQQPGHISDEPLDISQGSVRDVIIREALRWLRDTRIDGVRHDMAAYSDLVDTSATPRTAGWQLIREMNESMRDEQSNIVLIAVDDRDDPRVKPMDSSSAMFHTEWDPQFAITTRLAAAGRGTMADVRDVIGSSFGDTFSRVIYTQCADQNQFEPDQTSTPAQQAAISLSVLLTSPGIPMLFHGQELNPGAQLGDATATGEDTNTWSSDLVRDLVRLRRNWYDTTRGLSGHGLDVFHCNEENRMMAWHRWADIGPGDDVIVMANLSPNSYPSYRIGFPDDGLWRLRFSSNKDSYGHQNTSQISTDVVASYRPADAQPASGEVAIGPYTLLIFSQDRWLE